jgi:hypothetical protein
VLDVPLWAALLLRKELREHKTILVMPAVPSLGKMDFVHVTFFDCTDRQKENTWGVEDL